MDKLDQAILLILWGDEQQGQKLLDDVLRAEPQNDVAWFWLAAIVSVENRASCLENVLRINPNHLQARRQLDQLKAAEPPKVAQPPLIGRSEYWTLADKQATRVLLLQDTNLITFVAASDRLSPVLSQVNQLHITKEWYTANLALSTQIASYQSTLLAQIVRVRAFWGSITIDYIDAFGKQSTIKIDCRKAKISDEFMLALQKRLGNGFERIFRAANRWKIAAIAVAILIVGYSAMSLVFQVVQEQFYGTTSTVIILTCCIAYLIFLSVAVLLFANPPLETLLVRKKNPQ